MIRRLERFGNITYRGVSNQQYISDLLEDKSEPGTLLMVARDGLYRLYPDQTEKVLIHWTQQSMYVKLITPSWLYRMIQEKGEITKYFYVYSL